VKKKLDEEQDIAGFMIKIQEQLSFLEKKLDILINQKPSQQPFQRFDRPHHQREQRQDSNFSQRTLHKAVCADCSKECEVPFRPSQDRPVYCKDCFSKRKGAGPFKGNRDSKPWETGSARPSHGDRPHGGEKKKFFGKKRPAVKRRKARD